MPSRAFGEYEVLARLATGGAANIFLARHPAARSPERQLVCLKTLLPERARDRDFVDMFLDEARLASRLTHPNCVALYGFGKAELTYYLAMEYIFGETIWGLLTTVAELRRPLAPVFVASVIASALEGLHAAHELADEDGRPYQIVHRDISPQNIMVTYDGRTKLLDFGIAKAETGRQATATGIVKGKFSYMSPEQITGGALDRRSDIYSIGIVLFECLASRRLYKADSPEEIARMMLERRPPRLREVHPSLPPVLDEICATALARHAKSRFSTALEMSHALRAYVSDAGKAGSEAEVAAWVEERFEGKIEARRELLRSMSQGVYDEGHMLEVLGASPALDLDFRPGFSAEETIGEGGPNQEPESEGGNGAAHNSPGFRIELEQVKASRSSPLVRDVPAMNLPRTTSHGVEPRAPIVRPQSDAAVTVFEPERIAAEATQEEQPAALPRDTVSEGGPGPNEGAAEVSEEFEEDTQGRWPDTPEAVRAHEPPAPELVRQGVLSRAASFIADEGTHDTAPGIRLPSRPAPPSVPPQGLASVTVTPIEAEPAPALFVAPTTTPAPPSGSASGAPPASAVVGSSEASSSARIALGRVPLAWVVWAFAAGLGMGLSVGLLLGRA